MDQWAALTEGYPGWTLAEVRALTPRERTNWLAVLLAKIERMKQGA